MSYHETMMTKAGVIRIIETRIKDLKKRRAKEMAEYDALFGSWKKKLTLFVGQNFVERIKMIRKSDVEERRYRRADYVDDIFRGAPDPPRFPSNKTIAELQRELRFFKASTEKRVQVTQDMYDRWMGPTEGEEDLDDEPS